ncbi:MAG: tetratricopeptide repeat protein [Rubrivivax sp.]|nr:tetratricopeptide repeat protein [Rubrivivax sp.]
MALVLPVRADPLAELRRLTASGQSTQALDVADKALQSRPKDPELRFLRGVVLTDLGRSAEAMGVFEALSLEYPELPDPLNNLAVLHAARDELDRARHLLETALRAEPRHRAARENLGDVYVRLAIRQWQTLAGESPLEPALARKLALARDLAGLPRAR